MYRHRLERGAGGRKAASWYLEVSEADAPAGERVTVPVPFGSVLLLNQLVVHRSTENLSERIRWSVDLRYQRAGEPTGMDIIAPPVAFVRGGRKLARIDWSHYLGVNRAEKLAGFDIDDPAQAAGRIEGPWMQRWASGAAAGG